MPKPKKQAKNEDGTESEEYKSFDEELDKNLDEESLDAFISTEDDFNPEVLGIDKNMDSFDDKELF